MSSYNLYKYGHPVSPNSLPLTEEESYLEAFHILKRLFSGAQLYLLANVLENRIDSGYGEVTLRIWNYHPDVLLDTASHKLTLSRNELP